MRGEKGGKRLRNEGGRNRGKEIGQGEEEKGEGKEGDYHPSRLFLKVVAYMPCGRASIYGSLLINCTCIWVNAN